MTTVALDITGMTCAACSARVEKVLSRTAGVRRAEVNLALERASVEADDAVAPLALVAAVEKAGYGARLRASDEAGRRAADERRDEERRQEERDTLLRFVVSAALSIPLVIGTLPMMLGTGHAWIGPWTQALLATGVMLVSGTRFLREAFAAVRGGGANMAVLVSLGTSVAYFYSLYLVIYGHGHEHLYFEAAAVVLTLVMLGKYLEARAKQGASAALAALHSLQPREAERIDGAGTVTVAVETLMPGDRVLVRPGGRIPCDGRILAGSSSIDESLVTGESLPVAKEPGGMVITGTVNGEAALEIEVSAVGADTRLARMTRLIEDAQTGQAPIQKLVDRISSIFVPVILVVAVVTFLVWSLVLNDMDGAIVASVAVLVSSYFLFDAMTVVTDRTFGQGNRQQVTLTLNQAQTLAVLDDAFALPGVRRVEGAFAVPVRLVNGHRDRLSALQGHFEGAELARLMDDVAGAIDLPAEGVVLPALLARALDVAPGDRLRVELLSAPREALDLPVAAVIHQSLGGEAHIAASALFAALRLAPRVNQLHLLVDTDRMGEINARIKETPAVAGLADWAEVRRQFDATMAENLLTMVAIYTIIGVLIAIGVVYNAARIQLSERSHELASLRVMGFTRAEVGFVLVGEVMLLTLLAVPLGWLLGGWFAAGMVEAVSTDVVQLPYVISRRTYAAAAAAVVLASLGAALLVRRRLDRVDLSTALKARQ